MKKNNRNSLLQIDESVFTTQKIIKDAIERAALPTKEVMDNIKEATKPLINISKIVSDSLVLNNNFTTNAAVVLGNLASTASQIYKTFNIIPFFENFADLSNRIYNYNEKQNNLKSKIIQKWNDLNDELKNNNRYFPKTDFFDIFDECTKEVSYKFRRSRILYRARIISEENLPKNVNDAINSYITTENVSMLNSLNCNYFDMWEHVEGMSQEIWDEWLLEHDLKDVMFWGYNSEKSDAPSKSSKHGRINPKGISYLYTSLDIKTAIAETQPLNMELVSVAKIQTKKPLKLFSFDFYEAFNKSELMKQPLNKFRSITGMTFWELQLFFDTLSNLFSRPSFGNEENYYATQYLSEYIKSKGFDGVKFKSSVKKGGSNVVLFDTSRDNNGDPINYEIIESHLHHVKNVTVTSNRLLPKTISQKQQK